MTEPEDEIIRAKWLMDGSVTLADAAARLRAYAAELSRQHAAGWTLRQPIEGDYGFLVPPRPGTAASPAASTGRRFTVNENLLQALSDRYYPVDSDHEAVLLLNEAIMGDEPVITGPCEIAAELLADDDDGSVDGWRIIISFGGPWLGAEISRVSYRTRDGNGGYSPAEILRDAVDAANGLLSWYEDTLGAAGAFIAAPEPDEEFECCPGQWLHRPRPGEEMRCDGCGTIYVSELPPGWRDWMSPERVRHAIPPTGPCATCGRHHPESEVTP